MQDYYAILEVRRDASTADIKRAYRRLAFQHHPDVGGSKEKFQELSEAYAVLGDTDKRARYDRGEEGVFEESKHKESYGSYEDFFAEFLRMNLHHFDTSTSVDAFVRSRPRFFFRRDDDAWSERYPDDDIPYNAEEVKMMKLDEAWGLLQENLRYQQELYSRPQANPYAEKAVRKDRFRVNDGYEVYDVRLLGIDELFQLAFALKRERWLMGEVEYASTIDLIDEIDVLKTEYEKGEKDRDNLEYHAARAEELLDSIRLSRPKAVNAKKVPYSRNEKSHLAYIHSDRRRKFLSQMDLKDNVAVSRDHQEKKLLAKETGDASDKRNKEPWKEHDERKQWRKEAGGLKMR